MTDGDTVAAIERVAFRAFPATEEERIGAFVCRATPTVRSRRFNSATTAVETVSAPSLELAQIVAWYAARDRDPLARVLSIAPAEVEQRLADEGWTVEAPTAVATRMLDSTAHEFALPAAPSEQWLALKAKSAEMTADAVMAWSAWVRSSPAHFSFAAVPADRGEIAAIGVGAADGDWLGIFDMFVLPQHRRRGHARHVLERLLRWGAAHGCSRAYLQVMIDNAGAMALYRTAGFRELYRYWYRRRSSDVRA